MTKKVAKKIVRGITDKIECNTVDIDDWAEFWGFTKEEYEEFLDMAIKALEQQPITWIVGKDNCQVAVRNMSIDKMQKICAIIGEEEQQPSEDCIKELIREFNNKHPALFAYYMREFNNHSISEIIEYMWDMHDLIEDIKYRLPNEGGAENK